MRFFILAFCFGAFGHSATAQNAVVEDSIAPKSELWNVLHQPVEISATRLTITDIHAPMAVSVLDKSRLQTGTQQLSLYEVLGAIPGVFAMNPDNFTQDLRISIRGFGARSAFGIRGIRVFTDGLPEGTPDGQVDVDNLDMGALGKMEVVRGAASGIYGNASGGISYLSTETPTTKKPLLEAQIAAGAFGFQRYQLKFGQKIGKCTYFVNTSHVKTRGYRDWSEMTNTILNGKLIYAIAPGGNLTLLVNAGSSPKANDPGALTQDQAKENPRQAGANNLLFETGEKVQQQRVGLTYDQKLGKKHQISVRIFETGRNLRNRLPILANGYGDLTRRYQGAYLSYQYDTKIAALPYRLKTGLDLENQEDTRLRFAYKKETGPSTVHYAPDNVVLNQVESFKSSGLYLLQELHPGAKWLLSGGLRYTRLRMRAGDHFLEDGDQSGSRHFQKLNPVLGLNYAFIPSASLYANYATTFETPTLNELSNNPNFTGGFNPDLQPQAARSAEIGVKGFIPGLSDRTSLRFDLALFRIETQNDIIPYQLNGNTGRTFYRNAGATERKGVEIGLNYALTKGLSLFYTQAFSFFKYKSYTVNAIDYRGNAQPGIPKVNTQLELRYFHPAGFYTIVQARAVSKISANDANTIIANAYQLLHLRLGYTVTVHGFQIEPYVGVNNLLNQKYSANVQINAANGRYFEPAMPRYAWGGVKIRISK
jgi:iron complex outermembrane receptor protein